MTGVMGNNDLTLGVLEFARLLGVSSDLVKSELGPLIDRYDFRYSLLTDEEYEAALLHVIRTIDSANLSVSGKSRKNDWEKGWSEILEGFRASGYDLAALTPQYINKFNVNRLFSKFVRPKDRRFEQNFYDVYRRYIFSQYLSEPSNIFEFGCGTGYNMTILAQMYPDKKLIGLDWAKSSVEILNAISARYGFNMKGALFDFFHPSYELDIPKDSAFITFNAMEQIGSNYQPFLDFILENQPGICVNSEPILGLYDENNLFDYLAIKYHRQRNYLSSYHQTLLDLEKDGRISIIKSQRVKFGNLFHEGYSYVVWKVKTTD